MRTLAIGLIAVLAAGAGWAQGRGGGGGSVGGATGGGISGRNTGTTNPNNPTLGDDSPLNQHPLFFSGKVVLSDGAALPEPAKIQRACGEAIRQVAYTDIKGRFSFQTGQTSELPDVSDRVGIGGGTLGVPSRTSRDRSQFDCELRFTLPGFRPETVSLANQRYLDNPDLGTIILRRIANVEGLTVSATSSLAPKDARKAFDKGQEAIGKKNAVEAEKNFQKAVEVYPRYAAAWFELGRLNEQKNQFDDARKSYAQAVVADAKYIPPHERLAWIALRDSKWQEVADDSDAILRLDPIDYPDAYYLSGVANLQLGNLDAAEKNTREALDRDTAHRNMRTPYVLGLILAQKHDYAAAVPFLRAFLEKNPDVADAPAVRQQLAAIEDAARQKASSAAADSPKESSSPEKP